LCTISQTLIRGTPTLVGAPFWDPRPLLRSWRLQPPVEDLPLGPRSTGFHRAESFHKGTFQPNSTRFSPRFTSRRILYLKNALIKFQGTYLESFGPGIRGSPRESLDAGCRSRDPADPSVFTSRVPSGVPETVTENPGRKRRNTNVVLKGSILYCSAGCTGDNSTKRAYPIPFSCSLYRSKYTYSSDYISPFFHSQISPFSYTPPTRACAVPPSGGRRGSQDEGLSSSSQFLRKLSPLLALVPAARVVLTSSRHLLVLIETNFFGGRCMTFCFN